MGEGGGELEATPFRRGGPGFDKVVVLEAAAIEPQVTWGASPEMVVPVGAAVPDPEDESDSVKAAGMRRALEYMGLEPGTPVTGITLAARHGERSEGG